MLDFNVEIKESGDVSVLHVNGEIDAYTSPKLRESLSPLLDSGKPLVLNLEKVHFIDSTGLGTIAHSAESLSAQGKKMNVVCTHPTLQKIFDVSGLSKQALSLFEDEAQAVAGV